MKKMQNAQPNKKGIMLFVIITIFSVIVITGYLFFSGYFDKEGKDMVVIDKDNTEVVVEKKDSKEIEARLDELDIDLDDILNELEF